MKKITQKILAGILTLAMVLGCFGGMGTLEVKAAGTIESVTADVSSVSEEGGKVKITVRGTELDRLYYGRYKSTTSGVDGGISNLVRDASGNSAEKTFSVTLDSASAGQEIWIIGVVADKAVYTLGSVPEKQRVTIKIGGEQSAPTATKEQLNNAIEAAEIK